MDASSALPDDAWTPPASTATHQTPPKLPSVPDPTEPSDPSDPSAPTTVRLAALVAAVEGAALSGVGAFYAVKTLLDRPDSYARAGLGALMALAGGALLLLLARALLRIRGWARSPVVVLQILALPVGWSLGVQAGLIGYGGPILLLAVAELVLLFTPEARAAFWR